MKILAALLLTAVLAVGADFGLSFEPGAPSTNAVKFTILADGAPYNVITSQTTNIVVSLPAGAKYSIFAEEVAGDATDWTDEPIVVSEPSNTLTITVRGGGKVKGKLQMADSLAGDWSDVGVIATFDPATLGNRYFRAVAVVEPPTPAKK